MTKKVLFTYDFGEQRMAQVRDLGFDVQLVSESAFQHDSDTPVHFEPVYFEPMLNDIDALVCYNPFEGFELNQLDYSKLDKLKLIQLTSIGFDHIPKALSRKEKLSICNYKGGYSIPIAEWLVMNILQMMKSNQQSMHNQQQKHWQCATELFELQGKTIGFAGTGSIAQETAKRLNAFGVTILGMNTKGRAVEHFDRCYALHDSEVMLAQCDIVIGLLPGTEATNDFFNERRFAAMQDGVYFINVARGSIVDEDVLLRHLRSGKIKAAVLDVFKVEPLPEDSPFWALENVYITPHSSGNSERQTERLFEVVLTNLSNLVEGKPFINTVDLQRGY